MTSDPTTLSAAALDAYDEMCRNKRLLCDPSVHIHVERMECLLAAARRTEAAERKLANIEAAYRNWESSTASSNVLSHDIRRALAED